MYKVIKYLTIPMLALTLGGCGSKVFVKEVTPPKESLASYVLAAINVEGQSDQIKQRKGYTEIHSALKKDFIAALSETNRFKEVYVRTEGEVPQGSIVINLVIGRFRYLSGASSVMGGVFSGNSHIRVTAQLIDPESGETIGEIDSGAHTKSSGGVFRGSTGTLITKVSKELADKIASY